MNTVVLVHGWGGSFANTWERSGFTTLLADGGIDVVGVDLLGHGEAPKPHDPAAYADLTARISEALPEEPAGAIGFSLGALTLLRLAAREPHRFERLLLAGIGRNVLMPDDTGIRTIVDGLDVAVAGGDLSALDNTARLFVQYASRPDNDLAALTAVMKRPVAPTLTTDDLARVECPVLIVVGDKDFIYPADDLVAALPNARCVTLRNVDHFATPESFGFFDAALEFFDAI